MFGNIFKRNKNADFIRLLVITRLRSNGGNNKIENEIKRMTDDEILFQTHEGAILYLIEKTLEYKREGLNLVQSIIMIEAEFDESIPEETLRKILSQAQSDDTLKQGNSLSRYIEYRLFLMYKNHPISSKEYDFALKKIWEYKFKKYM